MDEMRLSVFLAMPSTHFFSKSKRLYDIQVT